MRIHNEATKSHGEKPNIVVILTDDQGAWALGCAGNDEIHTPHLDQLAAEGVRFSNFFCTSPVCSPARASLLTGSIPSQHGIHDWIREGNLPGASGEEAIEYLQGQPAYTEWLAAEGYTCGLSGKWHLGDSMQPQKGFSHWYVHQSGGGPYYDAPMIRDGQLITEPGYLTEVITDDALAFLSRQDQSQPFYLSVHYTAPHSPWIDNHPQAWVDFYEDCAFESCPQEPLHPWLIKTAPRDGNQRENLKGYFAAVSALDQQVGRLVAQLDQQGLRDNTLIVFLSDNGYNCGHHGIWGKGNGTFPQNMYDTSVRVPAIFNHLGQIPPARVDDSLLSGYDFMPTLLDYAGIAYTSRTPLPGSSFAALLRGEQLAQRDRVVVFDEYGPVRMIRSKTWKYVHRYPYGPHELYHLAEDPDERHNLIDDPACEAKRVEMKGQLDAWFSCYVHPDKDGVREAVTGYGQLGLAGPAGKGKETYYGHSPFA